MPNNLVIIYFISVNHIRNWKAIINGQINDLNNTSILKNTHLKIVLSCTNNNLLTDERQLIKEVPKPTKEISAQATTTEGKKGLTFNEKRELETIDAALPLLQKEKADLEATLSTSKLAFEDLQKAAERIGVITDLIDEKEMRWLELSEKQ